MDADFDTGQGPYILIDYNEIKHLSFKKGIPYTRRYLNRKHQTFRAMKVILKVGAVIDGNVVQIIKMPVEVVSNWDESPIIQVSQTRKAFVGRKLMYGLGLQIVLDPIEKKSEFIS